MMNFISSSHAVSLFPRTAFVLRRSMVARQDVVLSDLHEEGFKKWFDNYANLNGIRQIGLTHAVYPGCELGDRFVGDSLSWVMDSNPAGMVIPVYTSRYSQ